MSLSLVHCVFVFVFGPLCLCRCHPPSHLRMCWDTRAPGYASIRRILGIHGFIGWKPNASGKLLVCPFPNDSHANYFKSLQTNYLQLYSGTFTRGRSQQKIEQLDEEKHFLRTEIYLFHTLETMFRTKDPSQTSISSSLPLISAFFLFNLSQTPEPALVIVTAGPRPIGNCTTLGGKTTKWR